MYGQLEERLEQMPAVISCKLAPNENEDKIGEVHILANEHREISEIIKDIKTIILIEEEQAIAPEKINIAQIEAEADEDNQNRIEIISIYKEKKEPTCYLKLKINDQIVEKKVTGQETTISTLVVRGILEMIEEQIDFQGKLELDNVFITGREEDIIVVEIILQKENNFHNRLKLIGAAYIDLNLPLASGQACLKALNRQLSIYL